MAIVFVEDGQTGVEYKVVVSEIIKSVPIGFSGLHHYRCFQVIVYKPRLNLPFFKFYKHVQTTYKDVDDVESVTDLITDDVKSYLESITTERNALITKKKKEQHRLEEIRKKYDSMPSKIVIK